MEVSRSVPNKQYSVAFKDEGNLTFFVIVNGIIETHLGS